MRPFAALCCRGDYRIITDFHGSSEFQGTNGRVPSGPLVQGTDGNLYGVAIGGAIEAPFLCDTIYNLPGCGTVFKITPRGTLTTLHSFCSEPDCTDGGNPFGIALANDGNIYGVTNREYPVPLGTVFKITQGGNRFSTVYSVGDPGPDWHPEALIQAADGSFYGTDSGIYYDFGAIFKLQPDGTFSTLYSFCSQPECADGESPNPNALIQGNDGNFYGTTPFGGSTSEQTCKPDPLGCGTIYKMTPTGGLTTLYRFCAQYPCLDGDQPTAALVQGADGSFYGTTRVGGYVWGECADVRREYIGCGTFFKITAGGILTTLHNFFGEGTMPIGGLTLGTDGNFYGTTSSGGANGGGTIFKITPKGELTKLYSFCAQSNCSDGSGPANSLTQGTDGNFYGTTSAGGDSACNCSTVFRLSTGLQPFVSFIHASGKVGQTVQILGQGFSGATSVSFNGTPAKFTIQSDTYLTATVPAGAQWGFVTVATRGGVLKSNKAFRVTPQIFSNTPTSGPAGTTVVIKGMSLARTYAVSFGNVLAKYSVDSDTQVTVTVPAGSPKGKIAVLTPGGTAYTPTCFDPLP